jgi:hypothetical protein
MTPVTTESLTKIPLLLNSFSHVVSSCMLSHDSHLRCDFVDLYNVLYGTRRPLCIPVLELATILNVKHERNVSPMQDKEVIKLLIFSSNCFPV